MPQATEWACPTCQRAGIKSQIISNDRNMVCATNSNHLWADSQAFRDEHPMMAFGVPSPPIIPQAAHTIMDLRVSVPMRDAEAVKTRLGARLEVTIAGWISMLAQGEMMLITGEDIDRLKRIRIVGKVPVNAGELVGLVYAADLQATEAKDNERRAMEEVRYWEGKNPDMIAINLGEQRELAEGKARDANEPLQYWAESRMKIAIENHWF